MVLCKQEFSQEAVGGYARYNFSLVVGAQRSMQAIYDLTCSLRLFPAGFPSLIWFFYVFGPSVCGLNSLSSWI